MVVFPVVMQLARSPDYVTLDEALEDRAIEITEVDQGGNVPELKVTNKSSRNVLILDDYLEHFKAVENQVGVLVMIDGKVMGSYSFGSHGTLEKLFRKLVTSYAVDALEMAGRRQRAHSPRGARRFYEDVQKAGVQTRSSVDLGTDIRLENERVIGAALGHEDQILHLSVFAKESRHGQGGPRGSLRRASLRSNLLI